MAAFDSLSVPVTETLKAGSAAVLARWGERCASDDNIRDGEALPTPDDLLASLAEALERPQPIESEPDDAVQSVAGLLQDYEPLVTVATRQLLYLEDEMLLSLPATWPPDEVAEVRTRSHVVTSWVVAHISALRLRRVALDALRHPLTGLLSKVAFRQDLERELTREEMATFTVVAIDLDGFKQVNDRLGHAGGDAVLMEFAAALAAAVGASGTAYHLSGDEFGLVIHDGDVEGIAARVSLTAACTFGSVVVVDVTKWTPEALHDAADQELLRRKGAKKGWLARLRLKISGSGR